MFTASYLRMFSNMYGSEGDSAYSNYTMIVTFAVAIVTVIALYKIFKKAGEPGYAAIIPFYNSYMLFKIAMGSGWLFILQLIPFIGFIANIILSINLARAFRKGTGFTIGLIFLPAIFYIILGFSADEYIGPGGFKQPGPSAYADHQSKTVVFTDDSEPAAKAKTPIVVEVETPDEVTESGEVKIDADDLSADDLQVGSDKVIDVEDVTVEVSSDDEDAK
jgi:hypothetical protein